MWKVTVKGLLAHKVRLLLTALSVALGVAFVAGTYVLTDSSRAAFDSLFADLNEGIDLEVRSVDPFADEGDGPGGGMQDARSPLPESLRADVEAVDGVAYTDVTIIGMRVPIIGDDGKAVGGFGPQIGANYPEHEDLMPFDLRDGRRPENEQEVVIDAATVKEQDWQVGDEVRVTTLIGTLEFELVGVLGFGTEDNLMGATVVAWDTPTAQRMLDREGEFDTIEVKVDPDADLAAVSEAIDRVLPNDYEVITGQKLTEENQADVGGFLGIFNTILLVFAGVALFVGMFIIYNTFTIVVQQRTREMALLRALGASGRQVVGSVLGESVLVGIGASLAGLGLGLALARALGAFFARIDFGVPSGPMELQARTVVVSLAVGTVVTVVSAVAPARRAARTAPLAAVRAVEAQAGSIGLKRTVAGAVLTTLGVALLLAGLFLLDDNRLEAVGTGAGVTFLGVALLAPAFARPLASLIGRPLPRLRGVQGLLARENATRHSRRTASTASALMIGLALVAMTMILTSSVNRSVTKIIDDTFRSDLTVSSAAFGGFPPKVAADLRELPEVGALAELRFGRFRLDGSMKMVDGFQPEAIDDLFVLDVTRGSAAGLADGGVLVYEEVADENGWEVGDTIEMEYARTGVQETPIEGIFSEQGFADPYVISLESYEANFTEQLDFMVFLRAAADSDLEELRSRVETLLEDDYPALEARDQAQYKQRQQDRMMQLLMVFFALLGLSIVIAVLGVMNTLALSVFERVREVGLLRAVGMSRRQVRSMVRWEAVIIAVFGAVLGLVVGTFFGSALVRALDNVGITTLVVPPLQLGVVVVVAAGMGLLAAAMPARRAARLDVLEAIATPE